MDLQDRKCICIIAHTIARLQIYFQDRYAFARLHTKVPELQDVEGSKSMALLPTAQTPGLNWLKFVLGVPQ